MDAIWGVLPLVGILALCPLMMIFMMRGHGGHGAHEEHTADRPEGTATTEAKLRALEQEVKTLRRQVGTAPTAAPSVQVNGATGHEAHTSR